MSNCLTELVGGLAAQPSGLHGPQIFGCTALKPRGIGPLLEDLVHDNSPHTCFGCRDQKPLLCLWVGCLARGRCQRYVPETTSTHWCVPTEARGWNPKAEQNLWTYGQETEIAENVVMSCELIQICWLIKGFYLLSVCLSFRTSGTQEGNGFHTTSITRPSSSLDLPA